MTLNQWSTTTATIEVTRKRSMKRSPVRVGRDDLRPAALRATSHALSTPENNRLGLCQVSRRRRLIAAEMSTTTA